MFVLFAVLLFREAVIMASDSDAYNRKEFEARVTGSILAAELLRSEANGEKTSSRQRLE